MMNEQPPQEEARSKPPDASSARLQILVNEHWSLLATRSLTYTEPLLRIENPGRSSSGADAPVALGLASRGSVTLAAIAAR